MTLQGTFDFHCTDEMWWEIPKNSNAPEGPKIKYK